MKREKVSILIPCYNSESFLNETLDSCMNQSYENIEVIVVDDGSSDNSFRIAKEYESRYNNVYAFSVKNQGACHARNFAFEKCSGDYIMYLDADDLISPNKIETQIEAIRNRGEYVVSTCKWDRFVRDSKEALFPDYKCYRDYDKSIDLLLDLWSFGEMYQTSCYLVSRRLIIESGEWNESLKKNQDGEFFARVLLHAQSVLFCNDAKVYYRTGDYESVSKASSKAKVASMLDSFVLYKRILEFEDSSRVRSALAQNFALFRYLYNGQYPDLSKIAKDEIIKLGVKAPSVGTERVKYLIKILGFETFLKLRKFLLSR